MTKSNYEVMKKHIYKWVANNKEKVKETQRKNAANYYEKNKKSIILKRRMEREKIQIFKKECEIFRNILLV